MFSKFKQQKQIYFLDKSSANARTSEQLNIILSPALYWVQRVSLPVKNAREAKPLLQALFEEILPEGLFSYHVYKDGDDFCIFAYDDKLIIEMLKEKNVKLSQVQNVYFAQSEFASFHNAISVDTEYTLSVENQLVVMLPAGWIKESKDLDLSSITLSKHSIALKQYEHILKSRDLYIFIFFISLFLLVLGSEYLLLEKKIATTSLLKEQIFAKNGLKPTMMQNRSLLEYYRSIHKRETKIREFLAALISLHLKENEKIVHLYVKGKEFQVDFSGVVRGEEVKIVKKLQSLGFYFKAKYHAQTLTLKVRL